MNSREGFWGKGAIEVISQRLAKELPGLRGFSVTNLKSMRLFYEEWSFLQEEKPANSISAVATAELDMLNQIQDLHSFLPRSFLQIGFTHHIVILRNSKELSERLFYIHRCEEEHYSVESLKASIVRDDYHHQGSLPNNFKKTLPVAEQAIRAIRTFKDEYMNIGIGVLFVTHQTDLLIASNSLIIEVSSAKASSSPDTSLLTLNFSIL